MPDEKRASPRIMTSIEIVFRESNSFIRSYMLNLNNGGIFLKTDQPLHLDEEIALRIQLPNDPDKMDIAGRVVWTNTHSKAFPVGMGVKFINMAPQHQEKINAFVKAHQEQIKLRSFL